MIEDFAPTGVAAADGRLALIGTAAALCRWFDGKFRAAALANGAVECHFPSSIARQTLTRAGYFESFPDGATTIGAGPHTDFFLSPAVCYHAYALLADQALECPVVLTASQTCFREVDRAAPAASAITEPQTSEPANQRTREFTDERVTRLWEFTMREVIFVGPAEWVAAHCRRWTEWTHALSRELELSGAIEPATDAFFGDFSRGQRLIQQLKHLKDELRLTIGSRSVAAASFNLHETFFGSRFDLRLPDGSAAHSGCAAFGLERWALALLAQRGERAALDVLKG